MNAAPRRSRSVDADVARAMQLHREGRLDEAEALYRGVLQADAGHFDALHLLGVIEGQRGRFETALPLLRRAVATRPDNAAALNNLGNTLAGLQHYAEAVQRFDDALALKAENPKALRNRGTALRRLGRLDDALASFDRALAVDPRFTDAMVSRGELLQQMRRTTEAIAAFRAALAFGKDVEILHYALAALGAEPMPSGAPPAYGARAVRRVRKQLRHPPRRWAEVPRARAHRRGPRTRRGAAGPGDRRPRLRHRPVRAAVAAAGAPARRR